MNRCRLNMNKLLIVIIFQFSNSSVFSQLTDISVVDKFRSFSGNILQEKLFLHTDKEFYTAGEMMWFKVYYVDGAFHKPAELSKLAYVEIINEKNEPVLQSTVSLVPGESNSSFYLPTTLNTGYYSVKAYTSWMKNFDPGYFFEKKIAIVNTLKVSAVSANKDTTVETSISFFPEGGNLVNDILSTVGFTLTDLNGGINDCQVYILNRNNDTVTSFVPMKFGIGKFNFKPMAGNSYKAVVVLPGGKTFNKLLPQAYEYGYVMRVFENEKNQIIISVKRKKTSTASVNEQVMLAVHTRQVLKFAERNIINNTDSTLFIVDKKNIGQGVTHFTIFDANNKPVCERLYFKKPLPIVSIDAKTDKNLYDNREKIILSVGTSTHANLNLSASVFKVDSLQKADNSTIASYLWLASDLPGNIESPDYYFSNDPLATIATDNLMLTHGWRRFKWDNIIQSNTGFIKYLPEINSQVITGSVKDMRNDKPKANVLSYLTVSGNPFGFYSSESDELGMVQFEIKNYYGSRQLIAKPGNETDSFCRIDIISPFTETVAGRKYASYNLKEDAKDLLLQKSIGMQVQNIYSGNSRNIFEEPINNDTVPFYGIAENYYKLDDYKRFTTMEEVLREYVTKINVGIKTGNLNLKIFDPVTRDFYNGYALVMLDGVALTNPNKIFSYDPLKVKKLEVIANKYVMGQYPINGIASFTTYDGVFTAFELDPKLVAIDYNGLQLRREFYSPMYANKVQLENRMPDLRNTLLWSPDITTDKEGKANIQFYSSDRSGKYIVVLQGISKNGDPAFSYTTFQVD